VTSRPVAGRRSRSSSPCAAEGRDPATLGLTVGVEVRDAAGEAATWLPPDAGTIAEALHAWAAESVEHVQVALERSTPETFEVALDGVRLFRG
jgi:hypothetical protein